VVEAEVEGEEDDDDEGEEDEDLDEAEEEEEEEEEGDESFFLGTMSEGIGRPLALQLFNRMTEEGRKENDEKKKRRCQGRDPRWAHIFYPA
jgi:hypothetical protein